MTGHKWSDILTIKQAKTNTACQRDKNHKTDALTKKSKIVQSLCKKDTYNNNLSGEVGMLENQPVVLETRDLSKSFKGFTAVHNVNLQVRRNTIHALIGPNGAGKTTLFNLLTKFLIPSSGSTFFKGENITSSKPPDIARKGLVRSFQISAVFSGLTVLENVRIALQRKHKMDYQFWHSETQNGLSILAFGNNLTHSEQRGVRTSGAR